MATVDENAAFWAEYGWAEAGEEWSEGWGGSHAQWYGVILPRIARFLPAGSMLEIAPGHGRWTSYLREHCNRLAIVDLDEACIDACRQRFEGDHRIRYHVNDGVSLAMIDDESIDFAFSFDSLVHADAEVVASYLRELARTLAPDGVGFVHHSNAGRYRRYFELTGSVRFRSVRERLYELRILDRPRWRALDMTAQRFRELSESAGLRCISQEVVNWTTRRLIDCLSTFTRPSSRWARPNRVLVNSGFVMEAKAVKRRAPLYSPTGGVRL
jgi:SAM-dependent methyltransferase